LLRRFFSHDCGCGESARHDHLTQHFLMVHKPIDEFILGGPRLRAAVAGLSQEDVLARPGPGDWSILELIVHLADCDAITIDRMKRIIAEDNPSFYCADETAYMQQLFCHEQSLEDAVTLFEVGRRQFGRTLNCLEAADFDRAGVHNIRGRLTLAQMLKECVDHLEHHLKFLVEKRNRLGKPLKSGHGFDYLW
jgi:hypothetical protein